MAQEKILRLKHFVPEGHPQTHPGMSNKVKEMMPYLVENSPKGWTKVPDHVYLEVLATRKMDVPCLGFRKDGKEVYVHIFCNEYMNPLFAIQMVVNIYAKFNLGKPAFLPEEPNWIHTIPLPRTNLSPTETLLIHQITQSLFWTIYMDYKRSRGTGINTPN